MNSRRKNQTGKSELLVREVIFPRDREEAGTSQSFQRCSGDGEEQTVGHSVQIGEHEVKPVKGLKLLEKKPLENYFEGTKERRQYRRRVKTKKEVFSLNDFDCALIESDVEAINSDSSSKEEITKERLQSEQLQLEIYKLQKMKEFNRRKNHARQRLAEKNHLEELENLAETWKEYNKRRHQLKESDILFRRRHPSRRTPSIGNGMGFSIISRKYWNDSEGSAPVSRKEKNEEVRKAGEDTRQQTDCEESGKKLVFVYDDDSDES